METYEIVLTTADGSERRLVLVLAEGDTLRVNRLS